MDLFLTQFMHCSSLDDDSDQQPMAVVAMAPLANVDQNALEARAKAVATGQAVAAQAVTAKRVEAATTKRLVAEAAAPEVNGQAAVVPARSAKALGAVKAAAAHMGTATAAGAGKAAAAGKGKMVNAGAGKAAAVARGSVAVESLPLPATDLDVEAMMAGIVADGGFADCLTNVAAASAKQPASIQPNAKANGPKPAAAASLPSTANDAAKRALDAARGQQQQVPGKRLRITPALFDK